MRFVFLFLVLCISAMAADIFPTARRGGLPKNLWASAGVTGGRPKVTTVYTTLSPGATAAQINSAISSCPSGQAVKLAAGTYDLAGGQINLTKNGVVLRGTTNANGVPTTILQNVLIQTSSYWYPCGPNGGWPTKTVRRVASGYTEGSTSITLATAPNADFVVGDVFMLDQTDDGTLVKTDTQSDSFHRTGRSYCQTLEITGIAGNVISFRPALLGTYWSTGRSPEAVAWSSVLGRTARDIGVEDLDITRGSASGIYTLRIGPSVDCWVYNVRMRTENVAAIRLSFAVNCEITHSHFHDTTGTGSNTYATLPATVTSCKVENNIYSNLSLAMPCSSAVGCSFSYNFGAGPYPYDAAHWFAEYFFPHGGHTHHTIYEGNWVDGPIYFDEVFKNNNSDNGIVRNRIKGWASGKTANVIPITLENDMDNTTIIGNVLGENSFHTAYGQMFAVFGSCQGTIIKDNYNTVNDGLPSSEAIGSDTLRDSYCYDSKPPWFGDRPWPWCSPTNFTQSNTATNLPAGYRYFNNGADPPGASEGGGGGGGDISPPKIIDATIDASGNQLTVKFDEPVQFGAAGSGGWATNFSGGACSMTWSGATGTTFNLGRIVEGGETGTISYTQPGGGWQDAVANDLPTIPASPGQPVVNNSTQGQMRLHKGQVATPIMSVVGGMYRGAQTVTITCATAGSEIRYTTNGNVPTASSTLYTGPLTLSSPTTLRAIGIRSGSMDSQIATWDYEIDLWTSSGTVYESVNGFPHATGTFSYSFNVTPSVNNAYFILIFSPNVILDHDDMAISIWFSDVGDVKARNGDVYSSVTPITYVGGATYTVAVTGNVATHTYSATVNGVTLATNYAFRTNQQTCPDIDYVGFRTTFGTTTISEASASPNNFRIISIQ